MLTALIKRLLWFAVRSLTITYRFKLQGFEHKKNLKEINPKESYLYSVWHEDILSVLPALAHQKPYLAMASRSKDGDIASYVNSKMGFIPIRGSSRTPTKDKGGREAMAEYITRVSQGECGGITVDGPKGPRRVCKPGIVIIAQKTGAPIFPIIGRSRRVWEFNSWDRFKVPKFFSRVDVIVGEPILVPSELTHEEVDSFCRKVEAAMIALESQLP